MSTMTDLWLSGVFFQALNTPKLVFGRGSTPDPAGGAYDAPPDLLGRFYLAPFLRYGNLLAKNCLFFLSLSHSAAPSLCMFPLEFRAEVNHEETGVMRLSYHEDHMIVPWVVVTQCQHVTDRQMDRRTDGFTIASTALCIARYADVL